MLGKELARKLGTTQHFLFGYPSDGKERKCSDGGTKQCWVGQYYVVVDGLGKYLGVVIGASSR
jgi:hypothetical protein